MASHTKEKDELSTFYLQRPLKVNSLCLHETSGHFPLQVTQKALSQVPPATPHLE